MDRLSARLALPEALTLEYLEGNGVLPIELVEGRLRIAALENPPDHVLNDLELLFEAPVQTAIVTEGELFEAFRGLRATTATLEPLGSSADGASASTGDTASTTDLRGLANQPPVIRFVNLLLRDASACRASDVHFDATRQGLRVRHRIDGVLADVAPPPPELQAAVVSRLKLLAQLDIAERRVPQDGRLRVRLAEKDLDLRVATMPSHFGESISLRLLDHGARPHGLEDLGMPPAMLAEWREAVLAPHGIVVATGPTGSGKTTTLHAALALRDRGTERIITVEDPVEYEVPGVLQVPVNERAGLTFARALRAFLRLDPDVLMVGEMRDEETADVATRAAMTGHLVLTSLHTNDALSAIPRLLDLGVPRFLVAATLEGILAQRLVRRTCAACHGSGCAECRATGFKGRVGIFELVRLSPPLRDAIAGGADASELRTIAMRAGMRTMADDADQKVLDGTTTRTEVLRVAT